MLKPSARINAYLKAFWIYKYIMPAQQNCYEILGVERGASLDDIKKKYKLLAKQHHPDKGGDADEFKRIASAYETLADEDKRRNHDDVLDGRVPFNGGGGGSPFDGMFNDHPFFRNFMNTHHGAGGAGGGNRPRCGKNVYQELRLTLAEVYHGAKKQLTSTLFVPCDACLTTCTVCRGSGVQIKILQMFPGFQQQTMVPCGGCSGVGWCSAQGECTECNGRRTVQRHVSKQLDIPPGVDEGMNVEIDGWGEQIPKGKPGKLILNIKVDMSSCQDGTVYRVERQQHHLKVTYPIHFIECVTGKRIEFNHPSGNIVSLNTRRFGEVIQPHPNRTYTIKGKGMPIMTAGGGQTTQSFGDLIFVFEVTYDKLRDDVKDEDIAQLNDVYKRLVIADAN
jgi:DnaJ-class molecular chaperone